MFRYDRLHENTSAFFYNNINDAFIFLSWLYKKITPGLKALVGIFQGPDTRHALARKYHHYKTKPKTKSQAPVLTWHCTYTVQVNRHIPRTKQFYHPYITLKTRGNFFYKFSGRGRGIKVGWAAAAIKKMKKRFVLFSSFMLFSSNTVMYHGWRFRCMHCEHVLYHTIDI